MSPTLTTLHPDDLLFFQEVEHAMRRVAKNYDLPLRSITPLPMPVKGMADRLGDCGATGDIRLVLRCTIDGEWCNEPMSPEQVWDTAAHELSHLRHFNHGLAFQTFHAELLEAMRNQQVDHRARILKKLVKLQDQRQGEAALGNEGAAQAFAAAINRLLLDHELNASDIDYARANDDDPVIEIRCDLSKYQIQKVKTRVAWQESLAGIVADAHLCTILISPGRNTITFVGTRSHATVAEYAYGTLVPVVFNLSEQARRDFRNECRRKPEYKAINKKDGFPEAYGFRESWIDAFIWRIAERMRDARKEAVAAAPSESTSLVRLNGAIMKVRKYIDDKFSGRRSTIGALGGSRMTNNAHGRAAGTAAANRVAIGKRAISGTSGVRGKLGS